MLGYSYLPSQKTTYLEITRGCEKNVSFKNSMVRLGFLAIVFIVHFGTWTLSCTASTQNPGNPLAKLAWDACMQIRQPPPLYVTHRPHGLIHASQQDDTWSTKSWGIWLLAVVVFFAPVNTFWIHDGFVLIWPQLAEKHRTARSPSAYFNGWSPPILDVIRVRAPGENKSYIFPTPIFIAPSQPSCHELQRHLHTKHEELCEIVVFPNAAETAGGHRWFLTNDFSQWSSCSCFSGFKAGKTRCQAGAISCWAMARCRRLEASAQHPSAQHPRPSCQWFWLPWRPRQIFEGLPRTV